MATTQVQDCFDDIDLLLYSPSMDFEFDDDMDGNIETSTFTDADLRELLSLAPDDETDQEEPRVEKTKTPEPQSIPATQPDTLDQAMMAVCNQPLSPPIPERMATMDLNQQQQQIFLATVIKPPSLMEVKLFCRQEVASNAALLYLGSLTVPFQQGCLQAIQTYDIILGQTINFLKKLKPFNKLQAFYRIVIDHPIFTFIAQGGIPYTMTKKHLTGNRNPQIPRPMYTANENMILTFTFTMDIAPFGSKSSSDMFDSPPPKLTLAQRLGHKRPRTPDSSSTPVAAISCEPAVKKTKTFFQNRKSRK
jgi:hypothetical protein